MTCPQGGVWGDMTGEGSGGDMTGEGSVRET